MSERIGALGAEQVGYPARGVWPKLPLLAGGGGLALVALGYLLELGDPQRFAASYLVGFLFGLTLALGGLFFVLVHHLTRAGWGVAVRRLAEVSAATMPLFAVLFLPLLVFLGDLYHWTHVDVVAADPILEGKSGYLDPGFFVARAVVYFAVWSALGWWFWRLSLRQDRMGAVAITRRLQTLSAPGTLLFAITVTLASFDWIMSIDPHWYSTIFGVYVFSGIAVAAFASLILASVGLQRAGTLRDIVTDDHYHDLGKLLFGFVVFWAYIAFSQFMLIWYANLPEETIWFAHRWHGSWKSFSIALAVGNFAIPFFLLLSRDIKRRRGLLAAVSGWLLVMHWADLYWLVMPGLYAEGVPFAPVDVATVVGVTGIFVGGAAFLLRKQAIVPVRDPRLAESLAFENV